MQNQLTSAKVSKSAVLTNTGSNAFSTKTLRHVAIVVLLTLLLVAVMGITSDRAWSDELPPIEAPQSFHSIVDIEQAPPQHPRLQYEATRTVDSDGAGLQISGAGQIQLDSSRRVHIQANYAHGEAAAHTTELGQTLAPTYENSATHGRPQALNQHGTEVFDSSLTLTQDVYQDGGTTVTPKLGLSGSILQRDMDGEHPSLGGSQHLTSHMLGIQAGVSVAAKLSDSVTLQANADMHLYRSRAALSAEKNPYDMDGVHGNASAADEANVLRSKFGLAVEMKVDRNWHLRLYGEADLWNGVATVNQAGANGPMSVEHNGNIADYTIGVGSEVKF